MGIQLVKDKNLLGIGVGIYRFSYMLNKVLLCPRKIHGWGKYVSCGKLEVGGYHLGTMPDIVEFPPPDLSFFWRKSFACSFQCLHAGLFIRAYDVYFFEKEVFCLSDSFT